MRVGKQAQCGWADDIFYLDSCGWIVPADDHTHLRSCPEDEERVRTRNGCPLLLVPRERFHGSAHTASFGRRHVVKGSHHMHRQSVDELRILIPLRLGQTCFHRSQDLPELALYVHLSSMVAHGNRPGTVQCGGRRRRCAPCILLTFYDTVTEDQERRFRRWSFL